MNITPEDIKSPLVLLLWIQKQPTVTPLEVKIREAVGMRIINAIGLIHMLDAGNAPKTADMLANECGIHEGAIRTLKNLGLFERNRDRHRYLVIATPEGLAKAIELKKTIQKLITKLTKPR